MKLKVTVRRDILDYLLGTFGEDNVLAWLSEYKLVVME
jgi:hypothetical protein